MKAIAILTAALAAFAGAGFAWAQGGQGPALVRVAEASVQALTPVTLVPGTVVSRFDARLAAEVDGRLESVADVGTAVAAGDPVATIEDTVLRLRHDELVAEVARAEARLEYLAAEEKRFQRLADSNLAAATQLDQTRADRAVAQGDLRVAQSRLAQNEDQLARTVIRAPFDGVVVERLMMPGERVSDNSNVVRLVDPVRLEVIARAPLDYYPWVRPGERLELRSQQRRLQAPVRTVVAVGDRDTHQFEMRIDLEGGAFPVGQTLRVAVPMAEVRDVLAVPRDALVLRPEGASVFVVGDDGAVRRVSVQTGVGAGEQIEVRGALSAGDTVVIRGNERLQPGQQVTVAED
jgi:RND family efflux transporter MFP subunit